MSFLSGGLPQLASLLAQPAVLAAGVATGVAVGAVGVGTGAIPVTDPGPRLTPLYECPAVGRVVRSLQPDQKVLVTARNADGTWLELYIGQAGAERAWVPASALQLRAAPDSLPVDDCTPSATTAPLPTTLEPPSVGPSESAPPPTGVPATVAPTGGPTATPAGSATPQPTKTPKPTPSPTPSPTPPNGPTVSNLGIGYASYDSGTGTWFIRQPGSGYPNSCDNTQVTFQVNATDPDGVASATLYYQPQGGSVGTVSMYVEDPATGLYQADLWSTNDWSLGVIDYWVKATDTLGHVSARENPSSGNVLELRSCP
jgi:hypothetical protein